MQVPSGEYCIYLRKSRADLDAEARGEGETLAKHKRLLLALAKRLKINITQIYQEIVSGDRISDRPEVMKLLGDVEDGKWKGVLVVEVERLARGDTIDQGMVAQAFKQSSTLIVTPNKTYDPNNEFDEEYFEFGLFMSRREYKTIKRRLQRGRESSAGEGNYIGTRPPYGYQLAYNERGERFLEPHPEQANVVKMIFDWYVNGLEENGELTDMGGVKIARRLDALGIPTYRGTTKWGFNVILQMLRNEVYIGRIQWKKSNRQKSSSGDRKYNIKQRDKEEWINVEGKHEPLIDDETFERAALKLKNNLSNPVRDEFKIVNPMAGLIFCGKCEKAMVLKAFPKYRRTKGYSILCNNKYCDCKGSNFDLVENRIIEAAREWLKQYKLSVSKRKAKETNFDVYEQVTKTLQEELKQLEAQKSSLFDFLERKIYDEETFLERSKNLSERIQQKQEQLKQSQVQLEEMRKKEHTKKDVIPTIEQALASYKRSKDQQKKNNNIKSILARVEYTKEKHQSGDDFSIKIVPRIR
ncbi:recombinase family protein [Paenibacillus sp. H1-7]|uniref:recombinase family protein n=1 Tax=Paenibacillus sp. H1-7 TaxID=2282849 RepID=UPI001EF7543F|nr:recombinase family protein [Paenibacillus sp. H1-7]ULL14323.1 recombinase family protein [Paenibacillus sp. H1-7]